MYTKQIKQIETHCAPIKFRGIDKELIKSKNVKDFIENELFGIGAVCTSVYAETNKYQCRSDADRSIGDIYALCKYYFPETTVIDVIKIIYNRILEYQNTKLFFVGHYCNQIEKRVYNHKNIRTGYCLCHEYTKDEYELKHNDYFEICKHYENAELSVESNTSSPMILVD